MERGSIKCIYVLVCNVLLLSVLLDAVREGAYQAGSIRYGWFTTGVFALALFVLVIHLVAMLVALLVSGIHRAAGALAPTLKSKPRLHLLERSLLIAFLYINLLYFDILVTDFQIQLVGYTSAYSNVKQIVYLLLMAACVVFISPARIQRFIRNNSFFLKRSASLSLVAAVVLIGGRFGYKLYGGTGGVEATHRGASSKEMTSVVKERPNIILLTFDELSATHMSIYGYQRKTTPFLEQMAEASVVFDRAYSSATCTESVLPTFILGTYPTSHQFRTQGFMKERDDRENLLRILEASGYSVRIYGYFMSDKMRGARGDYIEPLPGLRVNLYHHRDRPLSPITQAVNLAEHLYQKLDREVILVIRAWGQNLGSLHSTMLHRVSGRPIALAGRALDLLGVNNVEKAASAHSAGGEASGELESRLDKDFGLSVLRRTLGEMKEPMFLWFHSRPPHSPFDPPAPYFGHYLESGETFDWLDAALERDPSNGAVYEKIVSRYDEFIRYMDSGLAEMMKVLEEAGMLERSVVIISSDHGLRNRNQNLWGQLVEEEIRVPLIVRLPSAKGGQRVGSPAGTVDIAPTVLELVGIEPPPWMEGTSLAAELRGKPPEAPAAREYVFSCQRPYVATVDAAQKKVFRMNSGEVFLSDLSSNGREESSIRKASAEVAQDVRRQLAERFGKNPRW